MFDIDIVEYSDDQFADKEEVIEHIAGLLLKQRKISSKQDYVSAVKNREQIVSTEIGHQIAIPHGESDSVLDNFVACLKLKNSIVWDEQEVSYVFAIGVPVEKRNTDQIKILARLCSSFMLESFRNKLFQAKDRTELFEVLKTIEEKEIEGV